MIERIGEDAWAEWREVRLEALQRNPEAFGSTFESEKDRSEADWRRGLGQVTALAHRSEGAIAGIAVLACNTAPKMRHRGSLVSMYVREAARGAGVGNGLVAAVLREAEGRVLQVHCAVVVGNDRAQRLYERHGFRIYGCEPRALAVGSKFYDEHLMVRFIGQAP